jgi:hypothetical protein
MEHMTNYGTNLKPETRKPQLETLNSETSTPNIKTWIPNAQLQPLTPKPQTVFVAN